MINRIFRALACLIVTAVGLSAIAQEADDAKSVDQIGYVDSAAIKKRFDTITAEDMKQLREKKILFASRSFGLNLMKGLSHLARENQMYDFDASYQRFDVFKAGSDLSIIPADVFEKTRFVHFLATYWPHTKRLEEIDTLLREDPHKFAAEVDIVMVYYHTANGEDFEEYCETLDGIRRDFPDLKVIYVTSGFMDAEKQAERNAGSAAFGEQVRQRYLGKVPLYDLGKILSDDFKSGHAFCPEFTDDPAGVHPSSDLGETMMAKGFLLVLHEAFEMKADDAEDVADEAAEEATASSAKPETISPTHPDARAVRAILDANGLKKKTVHSVAKVEGGRIVELYLQEGGIEKLPSEIGRLSALRLLHLYGDPDLDLPRLKSIDPSIGRCRELQELLLNGNQLTSLPRQIAQLNNVKTLSVADNQLSDLDPSVTKWIEQHDPRGLEQQGADEPSK